MTLIYFAQEPDANFLTPHHHLADWTQLPTLKINPTSFFIHGSYLKHAPAIISFLKQDARYFLMPLFVEKPFSSPLYGLCDGTLTESDSIKLNHIATEIRHFSSILQPLANPLDIHSKVLQFLFTRPAASIKPYKSWENKDVYHYPLIEALSCERVHVFELLTHLTQQKLLDRLHLTDRLHLCPGCHGAHLNFIDVCPACHHIQIEELPFLHCFTCGHVGPQVDFMRGNHLHCPRCQAALRHIGTDYDRPIENYHCHACQENFSEPEVIAHCFICDKLSKTEELMRQEVYTYGLSALGKLQTSSHNISDMYNSFDKLNYFSFPAFLAQLNWFMQVAARYKEVNFGLLGLEIKGLPEMVVAHGRYLTHTVLESCTERIRQAIRDTDISTRSSENRLWLLAPQTSEKGCDILAKRLEKIADNTIQADNLRLYFKVVILFSGNLDLKKENAETLIAKLNEALDQ